jgi:hypothetical protein
MGYTKFHKDLFRRSKGNGGDTHRQHGDIISLLYFFKIRKVGKKGKVALGVDRRKEGSCARYRY